MRRIWVRRCLLGLLGLFLAVPPALAVDLSDTSWDLAGRSRTFVRSVGRDFENGLAVITFDPDPDGDGSAPAPFTLTAPEFAMPPLTGTWRDEGGLRFSGQLDDEVFEEVLEHFANILTGASDADVTEVQTSRIWGHVNQDGTVIKMKLRFKVRLVVESVERRAWIKMRLRGTLRPGAPVS